MHSIEPGISRFRVQSCGLPRNDSYARMTAALAMAALIEYYQLQLDSLDSLLPRTPRFRLPPTRNKKNDRSRGPGISGHPRTHHHARRSAAGDAPAGTRYLFQGDAGPDPRPARR